MAIRPVDLQLAYLAAPQNAAILSSAQEAPQAAQQAAASAFAAEVKRREEHIGEPDKIHGGKVRAREERDGTGDRRRQGHHREADDSGEDGHLIDVTA